LVIGHVMVREAPKDVPKNGKRYHIHTFGCQVSGLLGGGVVHPPHCRHRDSGALYARNGMEA
jgi:hypothetical protein